MPPSHPPVPVPLPIKLAYTAFVAVLVFYYLPAYGPLNFLYFCDIALITVLVAMWRTLPLLASMAAVGILFPQILWMLDYLVRLTTGGHLIELTEYMFDPKIPFLLRCLSFFHFWIPVLIYWLVCRWGYDRRAFRWQCLVACTLLAASYLLVDTPGGPAGNVNKVFGPDDGSTALVDRGLILGFLLSHRYLWVGLLMLIHCTLIIGPTHLVLKKFIRPTSPAAPPGL